MAVEEKKGPYRLEDMPSSHVSELAEDLDELGRDRVPTAKLQSTRLGARGTPDLTCRILPSIILNCIRRSDYRL